MIRHLLMGLLLVSGFQVMAQEYFPKNDGVAGTNTNYTVFKNATIHLNHSETVSNGTLVIKEGKVVAAGSNVTVPTNAVVIDLIGKHVYPSFIDIYSDFGIEKPKRQGSGRSPQYDPSREGFYWNDHIRPEQNAVDHFNYDNKSAQALINAGFGAVNTHLQDGIIRGTGALIALNNNGTDASRILKNRSAQYTAFSRSLKSRQSYPSSIMGMMALLRQVHYDAQWYAGGNSKTTDRSLEAYNKNKDLVQIFDAGSRMNALRADKVGDDIGVSYVILGGGDEYERIDEIKASNAKFILPLNFPAAYDVADPFLAATLELEDMREWNQKPANPKMLSDNGISFALTTSGLKSPKSFMSNVRKAIKYGLSDEEALKALTAVPASILGQSDVLGQLKPDAYANFLITSGPIFEDKTVLYENWVVGEKHVIEAMDVKDISGTYTFNLKGRAYELTISGSRSKPKAELTSEDKKHGVKLSYSDDWVNLTFTDENESEQHFMRFVARVAANDDLNGKVVFSDGNQTSLLIRKSQTEATEEAKARRSADNGDVEIVPVTYPNGAFGFESMPQSETLLIKNATVWTNENAGVLENTDVLIRSGKIAQIGTNLQAGNAKIIDATGKHLTAGIIDEHSHIAASSINEGGQNSSAEVTIEDAINPDDIDIYRNLAGGVTTIQILHGSANPIGGRSAIIKLKWGEDANDLIFKDAPKFIKFALGENVKQSNWQSFSRFPQTRMGVEQLYVDYFTRAREYDMKKKQGLPVRKEVELEVLAEILNKERFISCHSYVQSEINMLMKVAEKFDFNVNTFTHILEGYKVADKMRDHGVGGSTFSDWWAYKYEVNDAIPYNAAIMHNTGVTVAINSDDGEMSRRLNQEAAKSVKYGGVSETDAWKFVTLNPAKLLHIDDRVGSIKVGKDADVVLWSGHPMSIYTKAEKTIIEGVTYFDIERDKAMQAKIQQERSKLIGMMLQEKNKGLKTQPIQKKDKAHLHCDSMDFNN